MWGEVLYYLVVVVGMVGGILLVERLVAGSHATSGTGYARMDSVFDVERLRRRRYGALAVDALRGHRHADLPVWPGGRQEIGQQRDRGERFIPVAQIVGSVDGSAHLFDRDFRPVSDRARARLGGVLTAVREGEPLPPIEVWAWRGRYYVLDGHHRVAAARALGVDGIDAHVIEVGTSAPQPPARSSVARGARPPDQLTGSARGWDQEPAYCSQVVKGTR